MVEVFKKIIAISILTMLIVFWGLVVIAALEGFSALIVFYIIYGIFATGAGVFYINWVRSR